MFKRSLADGVPSPVQRHSSATYAYCITALAIGILCILYHYIPGSAAFPLDDGYISLHSAQVLHWGSDPNFPRVAPLVGVTNAPYVLLLYLLLFALPPLAALETASWLGILCYSLGLVALGRSFRLPLPTTAAVAVIGLAAGKVSYQLLNGVETGMAMGLTAWIFALAYSNTNWSRRAAALLCGLLPFFRPELVALSCLVLAAMLLGDYRECKRFLPAARKSYPLWLLAALAAVPWMLWYRITTGSLIAQSIEAKRLFYAQGCYTSAYRWLLTLHSLEFFVAVIGFLVLAVIFLVRQNLGRFALAFIPVFLFAYYVQLPAALLFQNGRYTYVLIPILIFGLVVGLADRSVLLRRAAYGLLAVSFLQTAVSFPDQWNLFLRDRAEFDASLKSVADWTNQHLPENATLMIHDAGYVSYATKFRLVDLVGLKTPSAIESNRAFTYASCGVARPLAVNEIARATKPQYMVLLDDWDNSFGISAGLRGLGWTVEESAQLKNYRVFRLTPGSAATETARPGN